MFESRPVADPLKPSHRAFPQLYISVNGHSANPRLLSIGDAGFLVGIDRWRTHQSSSVQAPSREPWLRSENKTYQQGLFKYQPVTAGQ